MIDLEKIKIIAEKHMKDVRSHSWKDIGNKYYHGERVAKLVITLRKQMFPDNSSHDDILTVAAWFHDIYNGGEFHSEHGKIGANEVKKLLKNICPEKELDEICEIISVHDDRQPPNSNFSEWIKLHQDAYHLDHFGTFDVWMNFIYAVPHNQTINDIREYMLNERPLEFDKYRDLLNYDISKNIYDDKVEFLKGFTERFAAESSGEIWNLGEILENEVLSSFQLKGGKDKI